MKAFLTTISLSLLLFFFPKKTLAQNTSTKGVIIEKGTQLRIALAVITNISNKQAVGSNDMGLFAIKAKIGDTLVITKRHFNNIIVVVSNDQDLVINLVRADMLLEDVTIRAENKQQNLSAIRLAHQKKTYFYGKKRNPLYYMRYPLAAVMELFSAERKNAKRFDRYYENETKELEIDRFFNVRIVKNNTTFTGKQMDKFMLDYRPKYKQIKNWTNYDAVGYIKKSAKQYLDTLTKPL
ncbi:hypothetical protein ASE74_08640 [Pedobacter sp. Leaf216]|uniref:hypothetical protein n=1 Tax=Pedobacter sp. Leaf216 TaxID=1735684 RepID=UPI0006F8B67A|nr:hypothetical protein [Pedobacter sp. Leaf216]KQM66459.1 hypothetical protein ASE74_08640 [Pedobacter sp. Leaf216]RYG01885.1 MAG: hypothetical protein EOO07_33640 [Chitinophagaceae bacterium]